MFVGCVFCVFVVVVVLGGCVVRRRVVCEVVSSGGAFLRTVVMAIMCNWLVCMAVWMATSQKDLISKAAAVFFPISGFVAMGLDHSVANMFLIPFGIFCGAEITWADMVMKNLVPVTLGNLVGGAVFVAAAYHSAYGK